MASFLRRLTLFAALWLVGYIAIVVAVMLLGKRVAHKCQLRADVNAVIVGDSHTMWSINDSKVPGVRNISLNAEGYKYTYRKLSLLLDQEPQIGEVYIGVGPHNFSGYYDDYLFGEAFKFFAHRYLPVLTISDYAKVAEENLWEIPKFSKFLVTKGFLPALKGRCLLYGEFPEQKRTRVYEPRSMRKRIENQYYRAGEVVEPSASNTHYLQKLVDLCKKHHVAVTILTPPVHRDYAALIPERYKKLLENFVKRNQLEHYDFPRLDLDDSSFLPDGDHLNHHGASRATEAFARYHRAHLRQDSPQDGN